MSGEAPNVITPRQAAVAAICEEIDAISERLDAHRRNERDPHSLFHSQIDVFLEEVRHELVRAATFLEFHDDPDDEP